MPVCSRIKFVTLFFLLFLPSAFSEIHQYPDTKAFTQKDAAQMAQSEKGHLAPVYAPLAEQLVRDFDLEKGQGIGVDIGSGPGQLILELCKRTEFYWVNIDINPHAFYYFQEAAQAQGVSHRVASIFGDVQQLPLRDNYADFVVSRGSFWAWDDLALSLSEILRVMKPGAWAYIGRGLPRDLPPEEAAKVRRKKRPGEKKKSGGPKYDIDETEAELRTAAKKAGIVDFTIERPKPKGAEELNYGIWLRFQKPKKQ